jgi:hypothetical protein
MTSITGLIFRSEKDFEAPGYGSVLFLKPDKNRLLIVKLYCVIQDGLEICK